MATPSILLPKPGRPPAGTPALPSLASTPSQVPPYHALFLPGTCNLPQEICMVPVSEICTNPAAEAVILVAGKRRCRLSVHDVPFTRAFARLHERQDKSSTEGWLEVIGGLLTDLAQVCLRHGCGMTSRQQRLAHSAQRENSQRWSTTSSSFRYPSGRMLTMPPSFPAMPLPREIASF